ncbi:pentatricopeptide repeat-containing protein At5g15280, mitochondrial isoform X2 [Jatropha curcas]|uniref:pentatricopeptide repeat-containing protein At5g15280, mitochondrial isoform X2 n=1 Tax=Jatropha curcas TaxID=180498 RepID=UPI0005FBE901|nr:pentatricopeptide repeat-containing protein At5g15280, mitochondrial isoform X2 [Jatropha curcas]
MSKTTTVATTTTAFLRNCMLEFLSPLNPRKSFLKQVSFLFFIKSQFLNTASHTDLSLSSHSGAHKANKTHIDLSSINPNGIANIIISKYRQFLNRSESERENLAKYSSLKELLLDISDVIPYETRRFRRILRLTPEDVLEMLLGFQFECEKVAIKRKKVESLWGIFNWASDQDKGFKHLPKSCEVMSSLLIRYGMLREVQLLLLAMERKGISLDNNEIFSKLIEGYVGVNDLERAVLLYERMREQGLVPSPFSYNVLIYLLVKMRRTQLAFRVCLDMFEIGTNLSDREMASIDKAIRLLSGEGMVHEARNLMKKALALGFEPSSLVINEIASGYCEKKDFEDLLSFLVAMKCAPNLLVGNKIVCGLCSNFGVDRANFFMLELENLGFRPDEITFGILIGWCCGEGNLRSAFIFLSEMLSRGLKPSIYSYNALIGAMFREGMWKHAQDILDDMTDRGMTPNLITFRTLLAGYCKARKFDEVKIMVHKMVNCGLIESSSLDNPLSKAFMVLGLSPLSVRLKRDNDVEFSNTEFFDNLGNGLYLDTDLDEYEKIVNAVLKDSIVPDFNLLLREECDHRNFKAVFSLIDEMIRWGQELSLPVFSALLKGLCASRSHTRACSHLIDKLPKLANQLDFEVLNLLVQAYCKSGLVYKGRTIFYQILQRDITIGNETYTALIMGLCKLGNLQDFHYCWDIARNSKWLPELRDCKSLVECLLHHKMLKEALELLEKMLVSHPHSRSEICHVFLEKLSVTGFTSIAQNLVDELVQQGCCFGETAYSHLIRGLCKERNYMGAFTILDTMLARNLLPCFDVSLILIPHLCRPDRLHRALALKEISLREQSTFSFPVHYALVRGFCMTGMVGKAANVVHDMLLEGLFPDARICNTMFQGYCQANNLRKVNESSFSYALSLKELMLGDGRHRSLTIYNILVFYLLSAGNSLLMDKILYELQEKGVPLDEVTYNFLVYGFSKCKDASTCLHYLSTMISKGFRPSYRSLKTAVTCLCDFGELGKVLELSREMEMRGWVHGSVVQNAIVEGLLSHGKIQEAEYFLDRMVEKGLIPDTINYDNLIKRFCFFGRLNKAVDLMNVMLKKGNIPDSASYDSVIHGFCTRNQLNEAMDFHAEMLDRDLKPSMKTWDMLVHKHCQLGKTAEAENLLIYMVQFGETPTRIMFSSVINRYQRENNPRKASQLMQLMQESGYVPDFDTHWSLISNLQSSKDKNNKNTNQGFLSRLLSGSGLSYKKDSKVKVR